MLVGERTLLRPLERADLPVVADWRNRPDIRPHFFSPYLITVSAQETWYERYLGRPDSLIFLIHSRDNDERVGMIGLDHVDHRNQCAEYGRLLIDPDFRGRGFARDATDTLLRHAFADLNLNRLFLRVYADNARAVKLYEACGFVQEGRERQAVFMDGRFRDLVVMSILRDEFGRRAGTPPP